MSPEMIGALALVGTFMLSILVVLLKQNAKIAAIDTKVDAMWRDWSRSNGH